MKRSIARKWAQALASGEYKQTQGKLRDKDAFCCLGVLCNIHAQEHPEIAEKQKVKSRYMGESGVLPSEVMEWSGVQSDIGKFGFFANLASLNDDEGKTFPEIAKVIRKHWKEL